MFCLTTVFNPGQIYFYIAQALVDVNFAVAFITVLKQSIHKARTVDQESKTSKLYLSVSISTLPIAYMAALLANEAIFTVQD
jgi:hypothetical protein